MKSPLHRACECGHTECALMLINKYKVPVNQTAGRYSIILLFSCQSYHPNMSNIVLPVLNLNYCRHAGQQTPLHLASFTGNLAIIKALVENGANLYAREHHGMYVRYLIFTIL